MDDVQHAESSPAPHVLCREIEPADFDALLLLLLKGFPERTRAHYERVLERLAAHATPAGYPKYGYLLAVDGAIVGVVLTIFSSMTVNDESRLRINVSSWYVDPEFRLYAAIMTSRVRSYKQATHLNVTPSPHTWPMLEALGYRRICNGGFFALAALSGRSATARVRRVSTTVEPGGGLTPAEAELLRAHASFGCISVVCEWENRRYPFVFAPSWIRWKGIRLPHAMLGYCRDFESYVQLAGPLGRYLLLRGMPLVLSDANEPVPGLKGRYVDWGVKFARGPNIPHLGDLSYTERVMFELDTPHS
ncbi:MAG: acyl-CoA acyltransferase [Gemmatimonadales bacterium]